MKPRRELQSYTFINQRAKKHAARAIDCRLAGHMKEYYDAEIKLLAEHMHDIKSHAIRARAAKTINELQGYLGEVTA
jgi:hypothetical protein